MDSPTTAELSSLATQLADLKRKVTDMAETVDPTREALLADLFALERPLAEAVRRLEKIIARES